MLSAWRNKSGFTLVEVMIALFILMIGCLAIANVALTVVDTNMRNLLRDEAVKIADARINGQLRDTLGANWPGLNNLSSLALAGMAGPIQPAITVAGASRGMQRTYTVSWQVQQPTPGVNVFRIRVWVGWNYKGGAPHPATGMNFEHGISALLTKT